MLAPFAFLLLGSCASSRGAESPEPDYDLRAELDPSADDDGDGLDNAHDYCPRVAAEYETGCPEEVHDRIVANLMEGRGPWGEERAEEEDAEEAGAEADEGDEGDEGDEAAGDEETPSAEAPTWTYETPEETPTEETVSNEAPVEEAPAEEVPEAPRPEPDPPTAPPAPTGTVNPALAEVHASVRAIEARIAATKVASEAAFAQDPHRSDAGWEEAYKRALRPFAAVCDESLRELHRLAFLPVFKLDWPDDVLDAALERLGDDDGFSLLTLCEQLGKKDDAVAELETLDQAWLMWNGSFMKACDDLGDLVIVYFEASQCDAKARTLRTFLAEPENEVLYRLPPNHGCNAMDTSLAIEHCRDHAGVRAAWCDNLRHRERLTPEIAFRCGLGAEQAPPPDHLTRTECAWMGLRIVEAFASEGAEPPGTWNVDACLRHLRHADFYCIKEAQAPRDMEGCRGTFAP
ncbi:MAG: hypothetical protein EP329_07125 [Deltaproteobacteria bacterium]|nr:MAG: hypothetical protein EP329_07125 [Deltaproteobacteria bacterium]